MGRHSTLWMAQGFVVGCLLASSAVQAQVVPDGTLGNERSRVNLVAPGSEQVEGGALRGVNLFHSFREFNVREGGSVYFANPAAVQNIFSRVTGGNVSNINGTLGVLGAANLFLLNPNGIIFGPNARLDIAGSFFASTASGLKFADGSEFSATNPQAAPLLMVDLTPGLQRGGTPGAIANAGNLTVGKDLTLSGGTVTSTGLLAAPQGQVAVEATVENTRVRDVKAQTATLYANNNLILEESQLYTTGDLNLLAQNTVRVRDSIANPFVAWAGGKLLVQGNQNVDIFALNHPTSRLVSGGDMVLRSTNTVGGDAHYWSGGNFRIEQMNGSLGNLFSPYDPIIRSSGDVEFSSYEGASLHILAAGSVRVGNIAITGSEAGAVGIDFIRETVRLSDGALVSIDGQAQPTLDIRAGVPLVDIGNPGVTGITDGFTPNPPSRPDSPNPQRADIIIGSVDNTQFVGASKTILLTNQYSSTNQYPPNALSGSITVNGEINARRNDTFIDSRGSITLNGDLTTSVRRKAVDDRRNLAGDIKLIAEGNVIAQNLRSLISREEDGTLTGDGGNVTLTSRQGTIISKNIESNTPDGVGGDITLKANRDIRFRQGNDSSPRFVIASSNNSTSIDFSKVRIESVVGSVFLDNVNVSTTNPGSAFAGDIYVNAAQQISITNQSAISSDGNFGRIFIGSSSSNVLEPSQPDFDPSQPQTVTIDNSTLSTTNKIINGIAKSGDISIRATGQVSINNESGISTFTTGGGNAGSVDITAGLISLSGKSSINAGIDINSVFLDTELFLFDNTGNPLLNIENDDASIELGGGGSTNRRDSYISHRFTNGGRYYVGVGAYNSSASNGGIQGTAVPIGSQYSLQVSLSGHPVSGTDGRVIENEANDSIGAAQNIDNSFFRSPPNNPNPNIENPTETPYVSIAGRGNGTFDYYSFTVTPGSQGIFDIDTDKTAVGSGRAGNITLTANAKPIAHNTASITIDNSSISNQVEGSGSNNSPTIKSTIKLIGPSIELSNNSEINAGTRGSIQAGDIEITATAGAVNITGSSVATSVQEGASGNGGAITVKAATVKLENGASLDANTYGGGAGGNISVTADADINSVQLIDNAQISARTFGPKESGTISVTADGGTVSLSENSTISTSVEPAATGNGQNITITAKSVSLNSGSRLESRTRGAGKAGDISVKAPELVEVGGVDSFFGRFSGILTSSDSISSTPTPIGEGGTITIGSPSQNVNLLRVFNGGFLSAGTTTNSRGGNIEVYVNRLEATGGGQLTSSTTSGGLAGSITVNAAESATISGSNPSFVELEGITSRPLFGLINTQPQGDFPTSLEIPNSPISVSSVDYDQNIELSTDVPHVSINRTVNTVNDSGTFDYYAFKVETPESQVVFDVDRDTGSKETAVPYLDTELFLFDINGKLLTDSSGKLLQGSDDSPTTRGGRGSNSSRDPYIRYKFASPGVYVIGIGRYSSKTNVADGRLDNNSDPLKAGDVYSLQISINDRSNSQRFNPNQNAQSGLFTQATGSGNANSLTVNTNQLTIRDGARISAISKSSNGGDIILQGLNGQPMDSLLIKNDQRGTEAITAASTGAEGNAGNIIINVRDRLQATNGRISTSAENGSGGKIDITARDIWLSGDSDIRTFINRGVDKGGNITLNARSIIALGDSDILAYAVDGKGGDINFGKTPILLTFRYFPVARGIDLKKFKFDDNDRVDINASGALGNGNINFPDLDPSRGLSPLPTGTRDPSNLIDQTCSPNSSQTNNNQTSNSQTSNNQTSNSRTNKFINEGRGGLPPSPDSSLNTDTTLAQLATLLPPSTNRSTQASNTPSETKPDSPIVEAQGWIKLPNGRVKFVAQAATVTPHGNWQPSSSCLNSQGQ